MLFAVVEKPNLAGDESKSWEFPDGDWENGACFKGIYYINPI